MGGRHGAIQREYVGESVCYGRGHVGHREIGHGNMIRRGGRVRIVRVIDPTVHGHLVRRAARTDCLGVGHRQDRFRYIVKGRASRGRARIADIRRGGGAEGDARIAGSTGAGNSERAARQIRAFMTIVHRDAHVAGGHIYGDRFIATVGAGQRHGCRASCRQDGRPHRLCLCGNRFYFGS